MSDLPGRLRDRLARSSTQPKTEWEARPAAVLVPLYLDRGRWHVLFTRRTDTVADHRGQVAFPGGRLDDDEETPEAAALREAREEIGLEPEDVEILGRLDPLLTVTQYLVTPVVGIIPWPYSFQPSREEVARIFGVPLDWLRDPANLEMRRRATPFGKSVPVYYFRPYEGEVIWGVTARILINLLEVLQDL